MSEPATELLEPFSERNCTAWADLIRYLLAEGTPFEQRMMLLREWETKGQAQFLRAISTLQSLRAINSDLLAALEGLKLDTSMPLNRDDCWFCQGQWTTKTRRLNHEEGCPGIAAQTAIAKAKGTWQHVISGKNRGLLIPTDEPNAEGPA